MRFHVHLLSFLLSLGLRGLCLSLGCPKLIRKGRRTRGKDTSLPLWAGWLRQGRPTGATGVSSDVVFCFVGNMETLKEAP